VPAAGPWEVDAYDVADVRRHLHDPPPPVWDLYDLDGDGRIDARDVAIVRANYGRTLGSLTEVPPAAAPATSVVSAGRTISARRRAYLFA